MIRCGPSIALPGGPLIVLEPERKLPLVQFLLRIEAGSAFEPPTLGGMAELTTRLLRRGTADRTGPELERRLDELGASLAEDLDHDAVDLSLEVLSRDAEEGLALLLEVAFRPSFPEADIERVRGLLVDDIAALADEPAELADLIFSAEYYAPHPYHRSEWGTRESVQRITREDLVAFHRRHFRPERTILGISGDFDPDRLIEVTRRLLPAGHGSAPRGPVSTERPRGVQGLRVVAAHRPGIEQSHIRIGGGLVRADHPDFNAIEIDNTILGGLYTSRLVESIRIRHGLSYDIASSFDAGRDPGPFVVETYTRHDRAVETIRRIREELERFSADGPTDDEIERALRYHEGAMAFEIETAESLMEERMELRFHGLPESTLVDLPAQLRALDRDTLRRVANEHFPAHDLLVVVVTDLAKNRDALAGLGPITEIDARTGRPSSDPESDS